nr:hypothetical protein REQ54_03451 [Rhizobium sp. Q54]
MTPNVERVSATIYQLPLNRVGPRPAASKAADEMTRFADLAFDSCWYHDEAVREADSKRLKD